MGITTFNLNLSGWNVSNVTNMSNMFSYTANYASTWGIGNLSGWDTSNVADMSGMFRNIQAVTVTSLDANEIENYFNASWNSIGTLKVYADNISDMFRFSRTAKATINIYSNPTSYSNAFAEGAARYEGSGIIVNYKSTTTSSDSNVVKGSLLD